MLESTGWAGWEARGATRRGRAGPVVRRGRETRRADGWGYSCHPDRGCPGAIRRDLPTTDCLRLATGRPRDLESRIASSVSHRVECVRACALDRVPPVRLNRASATGGRSFRLV